MCPIWADISRGGSPVKCEWLYSLVAIEGRLDCFYLINQVISDAIPTVGRVYPENQALRRRLTLDLPNNIICCRAKGGM